METMKEHKKAILVNTAWLLGMVTLSVLVIVGITLHLSGKRKATEILTQTVESKKVQLQSFPDIMQTRNRLDQMDGQLTTSWALIDSEASRIKKLSEFAAQCGARIESVRSRIPKHLEDKALTACTHELDSVGDFRQIGRLLQQIYAEPGFAGIEDLRVRPYKIQPGLLHATFKVTWFAPGPTTDYGNEAREGIR